MADANEECRARGHGSIASIRAALRRDVQRLIEHTGGPVESARFTKRLGALLTPPVLSVFLYRMAHWLYVNRWKRCAWAVTWVNFFVHKVTITPQSCIGQGCLVTHPAGIVFHGRAGDDATFFSLCVCVPAAHGLADSVQAGPQLGSRVTIGAHAAILGSIRIEDDVKVAPNVRVSSDVPPRVIVISRNMRVVSMRHVNTP